MHIQDTFDYYPPYGWAEKECPDDQIITFSKLSNTLLEETKSYMKDIYRLDFSSYNEQNILHYEICKSFHRGLVRADYRASELGFKLCKKILEYSEDEFLYVTDPFLVLHLHQDILERGTFHVDYTDAYNHIEKFYTIWAPLNDCSSRPLAMVDGSYKFSKQILSKLTGRTLEEVKNLSEFQCIEPTTRLGNFLSWHGRNLHMGNYNTSGDFTSALVFRVTDKPINTMPWTKIYKEQVHTLQENYRMDNMQNHIEDYCKVCLELYNLNEQRPLNNLKDFKSLIEDSILSKVKNYHGFSFSLTLLSRRLEGRMPTLPFDLASILLGPDSLLSYKKVIQNAYKSGMQDLEEFATEFIEDCCKNKKSIRDGIYYKNDELNLVYSDAQSF